MVVVQYTPAQLWDWLNDNKCEPYDVSNDSIDNMVVIYQGPTGNLVPIQILNTYYPFYVCKICKALDIMVPDRFQRYYQQLDNLRDIQEKDRKNQKRKKDDDQDDHDEEKPSKGKPDKGPKKK